jgi:hypothetical protein
MLSAGRAPERQSSPIFISVSSRLERGQPSTRLDLPPRRAAPWDPCLHQTRGSDSGSVRALRRPPPAYRSTRVFEHAFRKPVSLTLAQTLDCTSQSVRMPL